MSKKKLAAFCTLLVISVMTACGSKDAQAVNMDDTADSAESSADLLIDTLEYILSEEDGTDGNDITNENETEDEKAIADEIELAGKNEITDEKGITDTDDGNSLFHIRKGESEQTKEDETSERVEATIYYGNAASDKLNTEISAMEQLTAENLVDALAVHNIVSLGTKVNSFDEKEEDGMKVLYLDLDKAFREYLKTMNAGSEKIILASLTATFLEAYDAQGIVITIDGKVLETNHGTYDEPFIYAREYIEAIPLAE